MPVPWDPIEVGLRISGLSCKMKPSTPAWLPPNTTCFQPGMDSAEQRAKEGEEGSKEYSRLIASKLFSVLGCTDLGHLPRRAHERGWQKWTVAGANPGKELQISIPTSRIPGKPWQAEATLGPEDHSHVFCQDCPALSASLCGLHHVMSCQGKESIIMSKMQEAAWAQLVVQLSLPSGDDDAGPGMTCTCERCALALAAGGSGLD